MERTILAKQPVDVDESHLRFEPQAGKAGKIGNSGMQMRRPVARSTTDESPFLICACRSVNSDVKKPAPRRVKL